MRMALGARANRVLGMVVMQAISPVAVGIVIGLGAAFILTRTLSGLLFDIKPNDPATMAGVVAVLALTAIAAAAVPALRASRIAPMHALREE
jgi:ABC-type antimicrobial peptide transport system permease subunit